MLSEINRAMAHSSSPADALASCALIPSRMHAALTDNPGLILLASQWRCLVRTYFEVLQSLHRLLAQHVLGNPIEIKIAPSGSDLFVPLQILQETMLEGERRMVDSIYVRSDPAFDRSWLLNQALKLGASTDVVDLHLSRFMWAFSFVLESLLNFMGQIDNLHSDLVQLTRVLSNIWASDEGRGHDFSLAHNLLTTIKCNAIGDQTSSLACFILQNLSHDHEMESVALDSLPAHLWIDFDSLQRDPDQILGEGGYGKVYQTEWLGGHFAVKDFFHVENNVAFGREAAIQAKLRHPNTISLVCCTKKPSRCTCSLVMELMQQDLRMWMLKRMDAGINPPFSLGVAMDLMLQIAQGMEYLHSLHIMHRDLKCSNILVNFSKDRCNSDEDVIPAFAHLKIADFGMSKAKYASLKYTTKQVGTTAWRAPEVFDMNPEDEAEGRMNAKYTKKADVYSFGLVCYEILTGKFPFEGTQVCKRVLAGERPTLPADCPQALSSYIESCWNGESTKRPPFSQICRVLRYLKAAVLFQDHFNGSQTHNNWLSQPLSHSLCASIDHMVLSFVQTENTLFRPQPLNIPLEMHCCRVALQQSGRRQQQQGTPSSKFMSRVFKQLTKRLGIKELAESASRLNHTLNQLEDSCGQHIYDVCRGRTDMVHGFI